ncbi:uncharacterized protein DUF4167 [Roseibium marinum]|uniref:Uncharacterized protein DUF4167 n=2 Tax=Roseibium marinum TaxID=281252 RepID=A0A2S3URQ8_9HYPH|nr:uncharacterized protein DUF4167 [Roseibium marinum]
MHIAEKYQQLSRDAHASGDRVMSENYNQHAEHYLRIVAAAQPQPQMAHPANRGESEEGFDNTPVHGSGTTNGTERPTADRDRDRASAADEDLVDADSPQPFIEDMPLINPEGQVNGAGQMADGDEAGAEEKPRRRARTPRTRMPRRPAASSPESAAEPATSSSQSAEAPAVEEQAKPQRRPARARRAKAPDEASGEASTAGELTPGE